MIIVADTTPLRYLILIEHAHVLPAPSGPVSSSDLLLGLGEQEAITLAEELRADALLMDDRDARREAERRNLPVLGTLRVLADAAEHGFADLPTAFDRLRKTNFRASESILHWLLLNTPTRS